MESMMFLIGCLLRENWLRIKIQKNLIICRTFSIRSMHAWRSKPKSMKVHGIHSRSYSSCSNINIVWLKYCWSRSFVKFMHSWLKPFNCTRINLQYLKEISWLANAIYTKMLFLRTIEITICKRTKNWSQLMSFRQIKVSSALCQIHW